VSYTLAHSELCRHTLARTRQVCAAFRAVVDSHQQQLGPRRWTRSTAPATTFPKLRSLDLSGTRFEPRVVTAGDVLEQLGGLSGLTQLVISDNRRASLRWGSTASVTASCCSTLAHVIKPPAVVEQANLMEEVPCHLVLGALKRSRTFLSCAVCTHHVH
jgi:hypothetical protein